MRPPLVFVTGASRSGTTMLARALGNHSQILDFSELHFFGDLWPAASSMPLDRKTVARLAADLVARQAHGLFAARRLKSAEDASNRVLEALGPGPSTAYDVFSAVLADALSSAGKQIACEQTPRNIFYAATILEVFPSARIIHIIRDPRAVAASQKNRWRLRRLGADRVPRSELIRNWFNYHPITMAKLWRHATIAARQIRERPGVRIVKFEELATEPERILRELCRFLGIEFEPSMLDVPRWGSSNVRHDLPESGISNDVIDRWTTILDDGEVRLVEQATADLMQDFAYGPRARATFRSSLLRLRHLLTYPFHLAGVAAANPRRAWIQLSAMLAGHGPDR